MEGKKDCPFCQGTGIMRGLDLTDPRLPLDESNDLNILTEKYGVDETCDCVKEILISN
jgi:hypothetical protein